MLIVGHGETPDSIKRFKAPDDETIKKQARSFDWTKTHEQAGVGLQSLYENALTNLSISKKEGNFRVYWVGVIDGAEAYRKSPPLASLDAAIELLLLFRNDHEKVKSMARKWKDWEDTQ